MLRHTRLGKRALTARQLALRAGLDHAYVRRLEGDEVPMLPEAGARLLGVLLDTPRDEAVAWLTVEIMQRAADDAVAEIERAKH